MYYMIPLSDAEALAQNLVSSGLHPMSVIQESEYSISVVFEDLSTGMCYMFTADYGTNEAGEQSYGFYSIQVDGAECVKTAPVVRQTETVTRWVPRSAPVAEEAEQS